MRTKSKALFAGALGLALGIAGLPSGARADVAVNDVSVPGGTSYFEGTREILEHLAVDGGGQEVVVLVPGRRLPFDVCVAARGPVAQLDVELAGSGPDPQRSTVRVEDGRQFGACLLASVKVEGERRRRRIHYCLRCETVGTPSISP